jgi:hypothetical protein
MTYRVLRSRRAEVEIEEIAEYLTEFSLPAAHRFLQALERAQQQLSEFRIPVRPAGALALAGCSLAITFCPIAGAARMSKSSRSGTQGAGMRASREDRIR